MGAIDASADRPPRERWRKTITGSTHYLATFGSRIQLLLDGSIATLDPMTGDVAWKRVGPGATRRWPSSRTAEVAFTNATHLLLLTEGNVWALDAETGKEMFSFRAALTPRCGGDYGVVPRFLADARHVVVEGDGFAFHDATAATQRAHHPHATGEYARAALSRADILVVKDDRGVLVAHDLGSAAERWRAPLDALELQTAIDAVFACTSHGELHALDPATGTTAWCRPGVSCSN